MEHNNIKLNKSELARQLDINRRTVDKYLEGYEKPSHRNRPSMFDNYFKKNKSSASSSNPVIRYETEPREQGQFDWKESIPFILRDTGERIPVNISFLLFFLP